MGICKDKEKRVPLTVYFPILLLFLTTSRPFIGGGNTEPSSSPLSTAMSKTVYEKRKRTFPADFL